MAELSRLLYVATTRAADYLILSSGLDDLDRARGPWLELLQRQFDLETGAVINDLANPVGNALRGVPDEKRSSPSWNATEGVPYRSDRHPRIVQGPSGNPARVLAKVIREEPPLARRPTGRATRHDLQKVDRQGPRTGRRRQGPGSRTASAGARRPGGAKTLFFLAAPRHDASSGCAAGNRRAKPRGRRIAFGRPPLDPLGLGTLVHAVLADLAAGSDDSRAAIEALVRRHAWRHLPESTRAA